MLQKLRFLLISFLVNFAKSEYLEECIPTMSMVDASGKLPSGMSSLNLLSLGNFDQCLELDAGKYCLIIVEIPLNISMEILSHRLISEQHFRNFPATNNRKNLLETTNNIQNLKEKFILESFTNTTGLILGICIPESCDILNLTAFSNIFLEGLSVKIEPLLGGQCQTKQDLNVKFSDSGIALMIFLGIIIGIISVSTIYDVVLHYTKQSPKHMLLVSFSLKTNGSKLLSISKSANQIKCLNGIRFLSMMWIVYGHRYSTAILSPVSNFKDLLNWVNKVGNMYVLNAPVTVDTFFVLSGMLLSYSFLQTEKFNLGVFYLHRYLRLTPVFAVLVWFHATLIDAFGSGPFWPFAVSIFKGFCQSNWWPPLLYIQNYYNNQEMCIGQTWYLSVDFQLFLLSPLILIPLKRAPKPTVIITLILVIVSILIDFFITFWYELPAFTIDVNNNKEYMNLYYITTHTRFGPYLMGILLGFILLKYNTKQIKIKPILVLIIWIISISIQLGVLFGGHELLLTPNRWGNAFFNAFHRHAWSLCICWTIFACFFNYGGPVNAFLSWSLFEILSRFTYTIFLVHLSIQYLMAAAIRSEVNFTQFQQAYAFWGDLAISLFAAALLTLAFESPIINIEKMIFRKVRPPKQISEGIRNEGFSTN